MSRPARVALLFVWVVLCLGLGSVAFPATKKPPPKPVNLNSATSEQLQQIPGIGPATAEEILQMRKSYGVFKSVDDLLAVRGIGRKRLDKMRKYLTVGKPTTATPGKSPSASNAARGVGCVGCSKTPASVTKSAASGVPKRASKKATGKADPAESDDEPDEPNLQ